MYIACSADMHGHLFEIEKVDLLLIAGDICPHRPRIPQNIIGHEIGKDGNQYPVYVPVGSHVDLVHQRTWLEGPFKDWLNNIPAKDVVITPDNHDFIFERMPHSIPSDLRCHILIDDVKVIQGKKIYASPWQNYFGGMAYNAPQDPMEADAFFERKYSMIPDDTDIFVIHGPPYGFGDKAESIYGGLENTGSMALKDAIFRIGPAISIHGHIHAGAGLWYFPRQDKTDGIIINAAICNDRNKPVNKPHYMIL